MINSYKRKSELARQLIHMGFGITILCIMFLLPVRRENYLAIATLFVLAVLIYILLVVHRRASKQRMPFEDYLLDSLEREGVPPAHGALWYAIGSLVALSFIPTPERAASAIFLLAIADGVSTIFGVYGTHPLPHNHKKTFEGSFVFFLSGLFTFVFIGWLAIPLSFLAAAAESLDFHLDDNLTIPVVCALFFKLLGA